MAGGGTIENSRQVVTEAIDKYPEVKTFGPRVPAYGIWARHVEGLKLLNVKFTLNGNDLRPAFICEDGKDIELKDWSIPETSGAEAVIRLEKVDRVKVSYADVKGSAAAFVRVENDKDGSVTLIGTTFPAIKKDVEYSKTVWFTTC